MRQFIGDIWHALFSQGDNPVFQREMKGWAYLGFWRRLKKGCLPLILAIVIAPMACCGLTASTAMVNLSEWYIVVIGLIGGAALGGELIRAATTLLATILAATTISAEVEAETLPLLRLTPIMPRQIVLAKFGAVIRQIRFPLASISIVRAISVIAMVAFAVIALLVDVSSTISNAPVNITPSMIPTLWDTIVSGSYLIALIVTLLFLVFLFAYYVLSPYVSTLVFAAVGILASTFARTRGNGVIAAAGLRVALWVFSYVASQFVGITIQLMFVPFFMLQSPPRGLSASLSFSQALLSSAA